jgi:hypothetical protein
MRPTRKLRWLRAVLGSVLALHLGFAEAGMVRMSMDSGAGAGAGADADIAVQGGAAHATTPCHSAGHAVSMPGMSGMPGMARDAAATPAGDATAADSTAGDATAHGTQHSHCCGEGLCHCAAASGFSAACASTLIGMAPRTLAPRLDTHATSQAQPALELRPPISR